MRLKLSEWAERERLAAEIPDKEQLLTWIKSFPEAPAMKTAAGKNAVSVAVEALAHIHSTIMDMGKRPRKAA